MTPRRRSRGSGPGPARVKLDAVGLWYAGSRAVVIAPPSQWTAVQNVLADVATIESVVRQMTAVLEPIESAATADVPLAYDINRAQRSQWDRLRRTMQTLAGLRLKFARLEPTVEARSPHGVVARRVRKLLLGALDLPHRVESLGNRMEACEDLYEGAVDRITDFRWWQKGNFLEIAIVALLGLETTLLVIDLILRMRSGR